MNILRMSSAVPSDHLCRFARKFSDRPIWPWTAAGTACVGKANCAAITFCVSSERRLFCLLSVIRDFMGTDLEEKHICVLLCCKLVSSGSVHCHLCSPELFVVECRCVSGTGFRLIFDVIVSVRCHSTVCPIYRVPDQNSCIAHTDCVRRDFPRQLSWFGTLSLRNVGMSGFLLSWFL